MPIASPPNKHSLRRRHILAASVALLLSTAAWLSLVFSNTAVDFWNRRSLHRLSFPPPPHFSPPPTHQISLNNIVFGIAGSSRLWTRRKEFLRLWWRAPEMRGHVWLDELVPDLHGGDNIPPVMLSGDISRFRYTNPTGHPSGLRISRIVAESFRIASPEARWFVLGDDDTVFNADNLLAVLRKYDDSEMVYIGASSESHSANTYFSHSMAFGGGGIAISRPLAEALSEVLDECLERYPKLYGSDDRLHACIIELGVPLTREPGFHQCSQM